MKKLIVLFSFILIGLLLASCDSETPSLGSDSTEANSIMTEWSDPFPDDPRQIIEGVNYYKDGYTNNTITSIDMFGRTSSPAVSEKEDKERFVMVFYNMTQGQHGSRKTIYDANKILQMPNGKNIMFSASLPKPDVAPADEMFFCAEPIWGYYDATDQWVIRRQIELFSVSGVDAIVLDVTNFVWYPEVYPLLMKIITEVKADGFDAPGIVFYTHTGSIELTWHLYNYVYKANVYPDSWFYLDGKPLIIAYDNMEDAWEKEAALRGISKKDFYDTITPYSQELLDFFTFKTPQWPTEPAIKNGFPWVEWTLPAPLHNDVMNVSVASHPQIPFSFSLTRGWKNWGRGYNVKTGQNVAKDVNKGTFFQSAWDDALKADPRIVIIGTWNEWTAFKSLYAGEYIMADTCNIEYSRTVEMMKTDYEDAFYLQMASNIRKYKYSTTDNIRLKHLHKTIDIKGDLSQWDNTKAIFRDVTENNTVRNSIGAADDIRYKQPNARNNIITIKVESDKEYLYFLLTSTRAITEREQGDEGWMNLFLTPGRIADCGWEGYSFLINRTGENGKCSIESLDSDFGLTPCGEAEYFVSGKNMTVKVPKSALGMEENDFEFYFKLADNITEPHEIMDYYISGKSLPLGRMSYQYLG